MPHFVIRVPGQSDQAYLFPECDFIIGRDGDDKLVLPNVSVSRDHAAMFIENGEWYLEDKESRNGTLLNGRPVTKAKLSTGDEVGIGKFILIFLGDRREDQIYNGRFVAYLPSYGAKSLVEGDSTFMLNPKDLARHRAEVWRMREAIVSSLVNRQNRWKPNDRELTFGSGGIVPVEGRFTGGIVARIAWENGGHVIEKTARFTTVEVDGNAISCVRLRSSQTITIGSSKFRYDVPKS